MKKLLLPILLFMMFIPFYVNAETCDTDKITISSITVENKSDNVNELDKATANGKNINLNLSMSEVGDNIEYKILIKNDSNEDYELNKTNNNLNSDYINYSFETYDNSNIVKAHSSKNVTLRVEYKTEVPKDKFDGESYNDNKIMTIQLFNDNTINVPNTFKNPNTGNPAFYLIILLVLISGMLFIILKNTKYSKFLILIIGITIPMSVYAVCNVPFSLNINVKISLEKGIDSCENCVYAYTTDIWNYGENGTILADNQYKKDYREVISESNKPYFLGLVLDKNKRIKKAYACGIIHDTPFCLEGSKSDEYGGNLETRLKTYNINKQFLLSTYVSDDECDISSNGNDIDCYSFNGEIDAYAYDDGGVGTYSSLTKGSCDISFFDYLGCYVYP